jgi:hypothetical protein
MRLNLNKHFKTKIIDAANSGKLATADTLEIILEGYTLKD